MSWCSVNELTISGPVANTDQLAPLQIFYWMSYYHARKCEEFNDLNHSHFVTTLSTVTCKRQHETDSVLTGTLLHDATFLYLGHPPYFRVFTDRWISEEFFLLDYIHALLLKL